jgi:hypothetical protein
MQTIERIIIAALLRDMRAAGYQPAAVWNDGDYVLADPFGRITSREPGDIADLTHINRPLTDAEALEHIDSVEVSTLHFTHQNATTWGNRGVMLVLGNGIDVISDHHVAKGEQFGKVIEELCDRINSNRTI